MGPSGTARNLTEPPYCIPHRSANYRTESLGTLPATRKLDVRNVSAIASSIFTQDLCCWPLGNPLLAFAIVSVIELDLYMCFRSFAVRQSPLLCMRHASPERDAPSTPRDINTTPTVYCRLHCVLSTLKRGGIFTQILSPQYSRTLIRTLGHKYVTSDTDTHSLIQIRHFGH